ncbi:MAG: hypothetical protein MJZ25_04065 [Fibrobacter sp.]|nr:hypothetical protein [Fibrobacter sp.]
MKQTDYNEQSSFAARRPAHRNTYQPNFVDLPKPTMQGGNFAPRPLPVNQPSQMFGTKGGYVASQTGVPGYDFVSEYNRNLQMYNDMNEKIKQGVSEADADMNLEKMNDLINHINGEATEVDVGAGNINQLVTEITHVCKCLEEPEGWLPPARANYADKLREHGKKLANALDKFRETIIKLKV